MSKKMVQIATFNDTLRAHFTRSLLEDSDIYVEVRDEHLVQADPLLAGAVGGIKIFVLESQVGRAREILADERDGSLEGDVPKSASGLRCPECGHQKIQFGQVFHLVVGTIILLIVLPIFTPNEGVLGLLRNFGPPAAFVIAFVGVWVAILRKFPLKCADCGHTAMRRAFEPTLEELDDSSEF